MHVLKSAGAVSLAEIARHFAAGACCTLRRIRPPPNQGNETSPNATMASLNASSGAVIATFCYCWLWFCVQDTVKCGVYALLDRYAADHMKTIEAHAAAHSAAALDDAAHPLQGQSLILSRAKRNGVAPDTAQVQVTQAGTVVTSKPRARPLRNFFSRIFLPLDHVAEQHRERVHSTALPNNVDLTRLVTHTNARVKASTARSGAPAAPDYDSVTPAAIASSV